MVQYLSKSTIKIDWLLFPKIYNGRALYKNSGFSFVQYEINVMSIMLD